jgi:predicted nucleic-acid-binding protein
VIGVDTNVIVRLLVADDASQAAMAARFLKTHCSSDDPALLSDIVLVETAWVLEDFYEYSRSQIAAAMEALLSTAQLRAVNASAVSVALERYRSSTADFADCLIGVVNREAGCDYTATFDRKASRLTEFRLLSQA